MKLLLSAVWAASAVSHTLESNPLGKVIELLDSLAAKITKEGEAEAKAYKEFVEWCDDASKNKGFEIKTATAKKAELEAAIQKNSGDIEASTAKIEELASSIATGEADMKSAHTIREKEAADFKATESELMDVIDTLSRAITVIEREMAKNPAAFAQMDTTNMATLAKSLSTVIDAASFPAADKKKLMGFVQAQQSSSSDDDDLGAPDATIYKTHSSNIVDVLEDLKEKAEEQLSSLRKAETNAKHNYDMLHQSLADQAAQDTKDLGEEKSNKAASAEAKAASEGELAKTTTDLADAKKALEMSNGQCMQTAADHDATVKARTEELAAIAAAKEALLSTTKGAEAQTYSLFQVSGQAKTGSLLRTRADLAGAEVVTLVKRLAREHHSAALAQLASRISAVLRFGSGSGEDPFAKVKGLISDLLARLESEAGADATEKAYCDEQMAKTGAKKQELEAEMAKLTSKIDQAAAKSARLKEEVKEFQSELATLATEQAQMDKIRQETHAAYVTAKADLELGLQGVRQALGILRDYYGSAAAASMLQQPTVPEIHSKATGAGSSIIGMLEVVESDFAKNLAAEETQEADASSEYDKITQENAITKTIKEQGVTYKTQEFQGLDKSISELSSDRETTGTELSAVLEYFGKIKERCIAKPETYEERKHRREAEIAGLKEALSILESETAFTQRRKRGHRAAFLG
jgi:septation ring formation regulator EzrA